MNTIAASAITVCVCCVVCALVNILMPSGATQKMFNLILGAFLICAVITPIKNTVCDFSDNITKYEQIEQLTQNTDSELNEQIEEQTAQNLVLTLNSLYKSNNLSPKNIEVFVNTDKSGGISITQIIIYIDKQQENSSKEYISITKENTGIKPKIILE